MKKYFLILMISATFVVNGCGSGQTQTGKTDLSPAEFAEKIKELPTAPVVDVRTPEEFSEGHLQNALNFNWNGNDFDNQISSLDKSKPVFVYCRSGARSAKAAESMRSKGFKEVYELQGGIMKWSAANQPVTTED